MSRPWLAVSAVLLLCACATEAESPFDLAALESEGEVELGTDEGTPSIRLASVPSGFFPEDRAVMWLGRPFHEVDHGSPADPVVILSKPLWERLGGRPEIVGTRVDVGGTERVVVGIAMQDPELETRADALIPR